MTARPGELPRRALVVPAARRVVGRTLAPRPPGPSTNDQASASAAPATAPATAPAGGAAVGPAAGLEADSGRATEPPASGHPPTHPPVPPHGAAGGAGGAAAGTGAGAEPADGPPEPQLHVARHLARRTVSKAWHDRLLGLSAEAAFWSLLSLPPLFLALLGSLGYFAGSLGPARVDDIETHLVTAFSRAFSPSVVDQVIQPTIGEMLRRGRADVISIGFLIALWAGSSAMSTFVNTVTIAYGMRDLRGAVRSRLLALGLYLVTMVIGAVALPLLVLGPSVLVDLAPIGVRPDATRLVNAMYWPVIAGLLLAGLITFYHLAVPQRLPWRRGVPGALLAAAVFLLGGTALRAYIGFVVGQGLTYGALAAPIAALLFFFVIGLAVILGAELNATIEELWPAGPTRRTRRRDRRGVRTRLTPVPAAAGPPAGPDRAD